MTNTNLLKETIEDIKNSGHEPEQIVFIGSENSGHSCTWQEYQSLANVEYDSGFGAQHIASDLIIVFSDGVKMRRHEYDGSESWYYSDPFKMPKVKKKITQLTEQVNHSMWDTLEEINAKADQ